MNLLALRRTLEMLEGDYRLAMVDGFELNRPDLRARAIVGADYKSAAVAAASVVAKVVRDRLMRDLAPLHPEYGFAEHVGYATGKHREALRVHGPCVHPPYEFPGCERHSAGALGGGLRLLSPAPPARCFTRGRQVTS